MGFLTRVSAVFLASALFSTQVVQVAGRVVYSNDIVERTSASELPSNVTALYLDSSTHKLVFSLPPGLSKRNQEDDHVFSLLRQHQSHQFCRAYCPDEYNRRPITVYTAKTRTHTVRKTRTSTLPSSTSTKTVLGSHSPASTATATNTFLSSTTLVIEAPTETVTFEETSVITTSTTSTVVEPTQITTESFYETSTVVITSLGPAITVTAGIPTAAATVPRGVNVPSWLRGHSRSHIVAGCKKLTSPPPRKTVTSTIYRTVTATVYTTKSVGGKKVTATKSIVQPASTITKTTTTTAISTLKTTHTPLTSQTETFLTTQVVSLLETTINLATTSITSSITTTTTTTAPGSTQTICQNAVCSISGGGTYDATQSFTEISASSIEAYCTGCYQRAGCVGWLYFGGFGRYLGIELAGGHSPTSDICPNGRGPFFVYSGGDDPSIAGGPGQCNDSFTVVT